MNEGVAFRQTRCRTCGAVSKGHPVPTLSPGVVLAYCVGCKRRMPSTDEGPAEIVAPTRPVVLSDASSIDPALHELREAAREPDRLAAVDQEEHIHHFPPEYVKPPDLPALHPGYLTGYGPCACGATLLFDAANPKADPIVLLPEATLDREERRVPADRLGDWTVGVLDVETPSGLCPECHEYGQHDDGCPEVDRIQAAYRAWRGTPDGLSVVTAIRRRALELRRRGWRRYGVQALAEVVRFDRALSVGPDAEGYKVNNSHLSRLARDLMDEEPELRGFFEIRDLRSERKER